MLLNCSNHPSVHWSDEQRAAAMKQYGGVEDLPFPNVPPEMETEGVEAMARDYLEKIQRLPTRPDAVHVMGEMTLTVALVGLLQRAGMEAVCSASERVVLEEADGRKTAQFRFIRFRAYPRRL